MTNGVKTILVIIAYRMPISSSKGIHTNRAQLNRKAKEVKAPLKHREEILREIIQRILDKKPIDVIIAGNQNKSIRANEIKSFFISIGVFDAHNFINSKEKIKCDTTCECGSK